MAGPTGSLLIEARIDGLRSALAILVLLAVVALILPQSIPTKPPGEAEKE